MGALEGGVWWPQTSTTFFVTSHFSSEISLTSQILYWTFTYFVFVLCVSLAPYYVQHLQSGLLWTSSLLYFILVSYTFTSLFKILSTKMVHELLCEPEAPLRPNFIEKSHCSIETADSLGSLRDNTTLLRYCTPFTIRIPLMIIRFPHYDIVLSSLSLECYKMAFLLYFYLHHGRRKF